MIEFEAGVSQIIQRTRNVKSFRFKMKKSVPFKPGQFFFVNITVEGRQTAKHFSFSNSPTEKGYVEFTKKITESPFSMALDNLGVGDRARLKLPYGSFTFEGEYKKIAFLSGGIGITPIRSMCKFAADRNLSTDIVLLYSNHTQEDIIFRQDFDVMSRDNKNMQVIYTLTSPPIDKKTWQGETGYIDDAMIKAKIADYKERIFYICGPPKMVEDLVGMLKTKLNIKENKIKVENFTGY